MKGKKGVFVLAVAMALISVQASAARPTGVIFGSNEATEDGTPYDTYFARCSNGRQYPMTAWDGRRNWCVGEGSTENCSRRQIDAAKAACRAR